MQTALLEVIETLIADEPALFGMVKTVVAQSPEMAAGKYSDGDLGQFAHGFGVVLCEAVRGDGTEKFDLYTETAVLGFVHDGQPPGVLIEASAMMCVLIAGHIAGHIGPGDRDAATRWMAGFTGRYCRAIAESAAAVSAGIEDVP